MAVFTPLVCCFAEALRSWKSQVGLDNALWNLHDKLQSYAFVVSTLALHILGQGIERIFSESFTKAFW
jgi:hypothetical protein